VEIPGTISAEAETPMYSWALRSHPGRVRADNEDSVGAIVPDPPGARGGVFVVCDGMGGHAAGEVASRIAVETVLTKWANNNNGNPQQLMRSVVRAANSSVFAASHDIETRGMGCTCTCLALVGETTLEAVIGHVGDSRCYRIRKGQCEQLTADHSRVGEMLRMRLITPEQARNHPARSQLSRSLGGDPAVLVDVVRHPVLPSDAFMLCSDGVWDLVSAREIARAVADGPVAGCERLISLALDRGAPDNVSVIVVGVSHGLPSPEPSSGRSLPGFLRRAATGLARR
jgi:PPM family protein phosphatase